MKTSTQSGWRYSAVSALRATILIAGIIAVLLVLANAVAAYLLHIRKPAPPPPTVFNMVIHPTTPQGVELLKRIHKTDSKTEALARLLASPSFEMHPTLHYMTQRVSNDHYQMGLEGIRYDKGWTDELVGAALASRGKHVYLFGGSTALGYGVSGNETISWYLNNGLGRSGDATVLNFGSQAYDQHREIEKLSYLLRAGYRPKVVVFLDGMNDIIDINTSNMRWQDKVIFHGFSAHRGEIAFTPGWDEVNYGYLFATSLPLLRLVNARQREAFSGKQVAESRDPFKSGFDFEEAAWMFHRWEEYALAHQAPIKAQLIQYFGSNLEFLEGLGKAFGFKLVVLYQPIGLFDPRNPFVPGEARQTWSYKWLEELDQTIKKEIASGRLRMIDLSGSLRDPGQDFFVDATHYSPAGNRVLAEAIRPMLRP